MQMKFFLFFSFCALGLKVNAQTKPFTLIEEIYATWIKYYHNGSAKYDTFLYADKIDDYSNRRVQDVFLEDGVFHSKQDTATAEK